MKTFSPQILTPLWTHPHLIWQLIKRDVLSKYRGSYLGLVWMVISPLFMMGFYTVIFGVIMKARWLNQEGYLTYALFIYCGLILFNFTAECITRAPTMIVGNPNYVKKIIFPLEVFPWVLTGAAFFQLGMSVLILLVFAFALLGKLHLSVLLLPLLFLPLLFFVLGASWFLSSLGVYFRDLPHVLGIVMQILMYVSAVFYDISMLPESARVWMYANPLVYLIDSMRNLVMMGSGFNWMTYFSYFFSSLLVAQLGYTWFDKTRDGFGDVV